MGKLRRYPAIASERGFRGEGLINGICVDNDVEDPFPGRSRFSPLRQANDNGIMRRFSGPELKEALGALTSWEVVDGKLHKEYKFADFIHAFGFMATAALAIEKMGHHPEWFNVYNRVSVDLTTHDAQGITSKDTDLAKILDEIATKLQ
jgi:4a-hydroxytetrahydrobiopterin dehydratase